MHAASVIAHKDDETSWVSYLAMGTAARQEGSRSSTDLWILGLPPAACDKRSGVKHREDLVFKTTSCSPLFSSPTTWRGFGADCDRTGHSKCISPQEQGPKLKASTHQPPAAPTESRPAASGTSNQPTANSAPSMRRWRCPHTRLPLIQANCYCCCWRPACHSSPPLLLGCLGLSTNLLGALVLCRWPADARCCANLCQLAQPSEALLELVQLPSICDQDGVLALCVVWMYQGGGGGEQTHETAGECVRLQAAGWCSCPAKLPTREG